MAFGNWIQFSWYSGFYCHCTWLLKLVRMVIMLTFTFGVRNPILLAFSKLQ